MNHDDPNERRFLVLDDHMPEIMSGQPADAALQAEDYATGGTLTCSTVPELDEAGKARIARHVERLDRLTRKAEKAFTRGDTRRARKILQQLGNG